MHIIYVEDDPSNIALLERVVHQTGDTLTTFTSVEEAMRRIGPRDADLILTDLDFGNGMDGLELIAALRERGVDVPIVAVSAYDLPDYVHRAEAAGNDAFVVKPISVALLIELIEAYRPTA